MKADQTIKLGDGVFLELLPRLDQEQYRKVLRDYDVGLSLMCSPHPSLVPMEMAGRRISDGDQHLGEQDGRTSDGDLEQLHPS